MKYLIFVSFLFILPWISQAQFAISPNISVSVPTGVLGIVMKRSPCLKLEFIEDFVNKWRRRHMGSITYFIPRRDTFNIYSISATYVTPSTQTFNLFVDLFYGYGIDYRIMQFKDFKLYAGLGVLGGLTIRDYRAGGYSEFQVLYNMGASGRTGLEFSFKKQAVFIELSRNYYFNSEKAIIDYNNIGAGIRFLIP